MPSFGAKAVVHANPTLLRAGAVDAMKEAIKKAIDMGPPEHRVDVGGGHHIDAGEVFHILNHLGFYVERK